MAFYPLLRAAPKELQVTDTFAGYNHNLKIAEGEWYDQKNMTNEYFPLLSSRDKRGIVKLVNDKDSFLNPQGILGKSNLAYVDDGTLYYGGKPILEGLSKEGEKQLISMGAYIFIYPDRMYINTEDFTDTGSVDASYSITLTEADGAKYEICKLDGSTYDTVPTVSGTSPDKPVDGALWVDTSDKNHTLKKYSSTTAMWVSIATVYTKISAVGIGKNFKMHDGVSISGCKAPDGTAVDGQLKLLNGSKVIYARDDNYIVVIGIIDSAYTQTAGEIKVERKMPEVDFLTEAGNRLWGCKYGLVNGKTVNEIYCCALGDFKNWEQYLGVATDSWRASVGTDGQWTGATTYQNHPIFFKENFLHMVYVSSAGAHQIQDTACRGVQKGSHKSLKIVNETLYYKSPYDVCAYTGAMPVSISEQLGNVQYHDAVSGRYNDNLYISMLDDSNNSNLFVFDTKKGLWSREDEVKALGFAFCRNDLYFIDSNDNKLKTVGATNGETEDPIQWSATSGVIGYWDIHQKYIGRVNLRLSLPVGSFVTLYVEYDSSRKWEKSGYIRGSGFSSFMLPIIPRRCDHFRIKLEGIGTIKLYSLSKEYEGGSDSHAGCH